MTYVTRIRIELTLLFIISSALAVLVVKWPT